MSVIKRLQRLTGEATVPSGESLRSAEISDLRKRIDAVLSRRPESPRETSPASFRGPSLPLEECVSGGEITTAAGRFFCVESGWGVSHHHGCRCIGDLSPLDMNGVSTLANDGALAGLDYTRDVSLPLQG